MCQHTSRKKIVLKSKNLWGLLYKIFRTVKLVANQMIFFNAHKLRTGGVWKKYCRTTLEKRLKAKNIRPKYHKRQPESSCWVVPRHMTEFGTMDVYPNVKVWYKARNWWKTIFKSINVLSVNSPLKSNEIFKS